MANAAKATGGPESEFTLYRDLDRRVTSLDAQITAQLEQVLSASEQAQLAVLDADTLRPLTAGGAAYAARCDIYAEIMQVLAPPVGEGESLFGRFGEKITQQTHWLTSARDRVPKYDGPVRVEFGSAMRGLLEASPGYGVEATIEAYRRELDRTIPETLGYPLGSGPALTAEQLKAIIASLDKVRADAAAPGLPAEVSRAMEGRFARAAQLAAFASALVAADRTPAVVKVQLLRDRDQAAER